MSYVAKRHNDDAAYLKMVAEILPKVKEKELILLLNFVRAKKEGRNLSDSQRSVITNLYYSYAKVG